MKKVSLIIICIIIAPFIMYCTSNKDNNQNDTNSSNADFIIERDFFVSIYQDGQEYVINDFNTVNLKKEPFSIRFTVTDENPYAYMTAFTDDSIFEKIGDAKPISDIPYFGDYKGMAPYEDGYRNLFLNDSAFHILYYDKEYGDEYLVQPIRYLDEGRMLLEWDVNSISDYENDYELKANPYSELYIVIFLDLNKDKIVNKDEFYRFELYF